MRLWTRRSGSAAAAAAAALALAAAWPAQAAGVHGRLELQGVYAAEDSQGLSAALGEQRRTDALGDLRVSFEPRAGPWSFAIEDELSFDAGDGPTLARRRAALGVFPDAPPATWWDLDATLADDPHLRATQRIDRLWIGWTGQRLVVRAGRQALTWGAGLVFRPMDLFDPFAPDATDLEYKPGTDMLYGQWLFDDGSDLQLVAVPRPPRSGAGVTSDASSYALRYHAAVGRLQTTWLAARDHGDWTFGAGLAGQLAGAAWNLEVVPTLVRGGGTAVSMIANISDALKLAGRDATVFAEYHRNGFGLGGGYALDQLPAPLRDRLARGQVFDTGRDYLAVGGTWQVTPLVQLAPTAIVNLDDGSAYVLAQASVSVRENLDLVAGLQAPIGPPHTEFGGLPLTETAAPFLETPARAYLQLRRYF